MTADEIEATKYSLKVLRTIALDLGVTLQHVHEQIEAHERTLLKTVLFKRGEEMELALPHGWSCTKNNNPTGFCVYDERQDPAHDDCLFCKLPEERT